MPPSDDKETQEQRMDRLERALADAAEQVATLINLDHGIAKDLQDFSKRLESVEARLARVFPDFTNCPKCGRKANFGAHQCQVCGHTW